MTDFCCDLKVLQKLWLLIIYIYICYTLKQEYKSIYIVYVSLSLGKTFTLLCVDPDVPRATAGTQERPLLHWMVVNIPEGRVAEGDTVMTYRGPQPPDTAHYYYFLLYEQTNSINTTKAANYTNPPISR